MDIQEIREGIDLIVSTSRGHPDAVTEILLYLAEKDACFPVEGELPIDDEIWFEAFVAEVYPDIFDGSLEYGAYDAEKQKVRELLELLDPILQYLKEEADYKKVITLKEMLGADK